MVSYEVWNQAIIEHVTVGAALGSMVYLAIDEDVIGEIGRGLTGRTDQQDDHFADFKRAVRDRVVMQGKRLALGDVLQPSRTELPNGVGFLSLMVLAATNMADEELDGKARIDEKDYFRRLRALLGLEQVVGRPVGLRPGDEEPLWVQWNKWLQAAGFVTTARHGEGPRRFINYPISQTLLRKADKDRLRRIFTRLHWHADWDGETLLIQLRNQPNALHSRYLLEVLSRPGPRYQALSDLLYDLHESWRESPDEMEPGSRTSNATLRCGLLRVADPIFGTVSYRLYPRTPAGRLITEGRLRQGGEDHRLAVERPGWFAALGDVSGEELTRGATFPVSGIDRITRAVLPERSFWVLVPDPGEPDSGFYASWRHPTLGEPAMVLIARHALPLLEQLSAERLVRWDGEPRQIASLDNEWLEVRNCLVTSEALGGVFGDAQALFEELRPATKLGISTRGGLRSPDRRGWIAGYGPDITVSGFESEVELRVTRVEDDAVMIDRSIACMASQRLEIATPGTYRIDASANGHEATPRIVRLANWEELRSAEQVDRSSIIVGDTQILGATLRPISTGGA